MGLHGTDHTQFCATSTTIKCSSLIAVVGWNRNVPNILEGERFNGALRQACISVGTSQEISLCRCACGPQNPSIVPSCLVAFLLNTGADYAIHITLASLRISGLYRRLALAHPKHTRSFSQTA